MIYIVTNSSFGDTFVVGATTDFDVAVRIAKGGYGYIPPVVSILSVSHYSPTVVSRVDDRAHRRPARMGTISGRDT